MTVFLPPELGADRFENEALDRLAETIRKSKILGLSLEAIRADVLKQDWPEGLVDWYLARVDLFGPELTIRVNRSSEGSSDPRVTYTRTTDPLSKTLIVVGLSATFLIVGGAPGGSLLLGLIGQPICLALFVLVSALVVRGLDRRQKEWIPRKVSRLGGILFLVGGSIAVAASGTVAISDGPSHGPLGILEAFGATLYMASIAFLCPVQTTLLFLSVAFLFGGVPWYDWALVLPPLAFLAGFAVEADDKGHSSWWGLAGAFEIILPARSQPRQARRVILI